MPSRATRQPSSVDPEEALSNALAPAHGRSFSAPASGAHSSQEIRAVAVASEAPTETHIQFDRAGGTGSDGNTGSNTGPSGDSDEPAKKSTHPAARLAVPAWAPPLLAGALLGLLCAHGVAWGARTGGELPPPLFAPTPLGDVSADALGPFWTVLLVAFGSFLPLLDAVASVAACAAAKRAAQPESAPVPVWRGAVRAAAAAAATAGALCLICAGGTPRVSHAHAPLIAGGLGGVWAWTVAFAVGILGSAIGGAADTAIVVLMGLMCVCMFFAGFGSMAMYGFAEYAGAAVGAFVFVSSAVVYFAAVAWYVRREKVVFVTDSGKVAQS